MRRPHLLKLLQPLAAASLVPKRIFANSFGKFFGKKIRIFWALRCSAGVFDSGIDVLGVLAEDHHIHFFGAFDGRGHSLKVSHRTKTNVKIEHLPQRHVERANSTADGRGQRALDPHLEDFESLDGVIRKPAFEFRELFSPAKTSIQAIFFFPP